MAQTPAQGGVAIRRAVFSACEDAEICRALMREYAAHLNASVGSQHICVDSLEEELGELPGLYAEPAGVVLLAWVDGQPAGCVALKPVPLPAGERVCEMKRLWVRPAHQGQGLGRRLVELLFEEGRSRGYSAMVLDTMPESMQAAYALYRSLGFVPVEPVHDNPVLRQIDPSGIVWLRREL